ncbi:MAG TPA: proline racemase family protein, partial [Usitatibacteraceae bacterium]|nr:proline racemase family protein [Usitatibacteraceae bacterium]
MARPTLEIIDSHTGGEPTRVVVSGLPDLGGGSLAAQRECLLNRHARWLGGIVGEPRSSAVVVGAILTAPFSPGATAGVIFFNNVGALGMCGHGSIGLMETLLFLGRIGPGEHMIDTPVGSVTCRLHDDGRVSVRNVPSYRLARDVAVALADGQIARGDIAWGGNWFFLVGDAPVPVEFGNIAALSRHAAAIRAA